MAKVIKLPLWQIIIGFLDVLIRSDCTGFARIRSVWECRRRRDRFAFYLDRLIRYSELTGLKGQKSWTMWNMEKICWIDLYRFSRTKPCNHNVEMKIKEKNCVYKSVLYYSAFQSSSDSSPLCNLLWKIQIVLIFIYQRVLSINFRKIQIQFPVVASFVCLLRGAYYEN